jgi:hypothetical protein
MTHVNGKGEKVSLAPLVIRKVDDDMMMMTGNVVVVTVHDLGQRIGETVLGTPPAYHATRLVSENARKIVTVIDRGDIPVVSNLIMKNRERRVNGVVRMIYEVVKERYPATLDCSCSDLARMVWIMERKRMMKDLKKARFTISSVIFLER